MLLNPEAVKREINNLAALYPDLAEDDELWTLAIESETSAHELLTQIVRRIEDTKALVIGTKDRFEELKARKDRFEHRIDTLRELAFKIMSAAELAKLELPEATLSLRAGTQQLVGEADPATLPDSLCKILRAPDRAAIKDALKTGQTIPGYELSNSPPSLSIRIK